MITAATFWLTIVAGPFDSIEACERAKVLTVPGPMVTYRCNMEGTPIEPAPVESPLPPKKPAAK